MKENKVFLDYLADIAAWVLGGGIFIYLGFRTLDFLAWTFRDEDVIFSYLGLFSTTIGAAIFALIYKRSFYFDRRAQIWRSDEFKKTVSLVMAIACALGEIGLAVADMSLIASLKGGAIMLTEGELTTFMWATAGLAGLVGISIAVIKIVPPHPKTDPEIDMSNEVRSFQVENPCYTIDVLSLSDTNIVGVHIDYDFDLFAYWQWNHSNIFSRLINFDFGKVYRAKCINRCSGDTLNIEENINVIKK